MCVCVCVIPLGITIYICDFYLLVTFYHLDKVWKPRFHLDPFIFLNFMYLCLEYQMVLEFLFQSSDRIYPVHEGKDNLLHVPTILPSLSFFHPSQSMLQDSFFLFIYLLLNYFIVVQLQLSAFSPHPSQTHRPPLLPPSRLVLSMCPV